jgi:hypothetical protein
VADSSYARKHSGERGPDAARRERAHQRVSRAADSKAKLTVALDGARAQRWPRNRRWMSADGGRAPCSRGQSEREGERAGQRAQKQGAGLKRGAAARTWPENAWTWARPRRGDHGREVEDELTGGDVSHPVLGAEPGA